jgi:hypothetical protein
MDCLWPQPYQAQCVLGEGGHSTFQALARALFGFQQMESFIQEQIQYRCITLIIENSSSHIKQTKRIESPFSMMDKSFKMYFWRRHDARNSYY